MTSPTKTDYYVYLFSNTMMYCKKQNFFNKLKYVGEINITKATLQEQDERTSILTSNSNPQFHFL